MTLSRDDWSPPFANWPAWMCPTCQSGTLQLRKDAFKSVETGPSEKGHSHPAWEPDWIINRFAGVFICTNDRCGEVVSCCGSSSIEEFIIEDEMRDQEQTWREIHTPLFFSPPLHFFRIPSQCPETISEELNRAFAATWSDLGASVNRTRAAIEALLTDCKIPKTTVNRHGKRVHINLHDRIAKFRAKDPDSANCLEAIKWVGNFGSHSSANSLSIDDILDIYDVFEHVIQVVYIKNAKEIRKIAKAIVKRKGRPKPRRGLNSSK